MFLWGQLAIAETGAGTATGRWERSLIERDPRPMLRVMEKHPQLFSDLPPIPQDVAIGPGFVFKP